MVTKYCNSCKQEKPLNEFGKCKSYNDGLSVYCMVCKRKKSRELTLKNPQYIKAKNHRMYIKHLLKTSKGRYYRLRARAHRENKEFLISLVEYEQWFAEQPKTCFYCKQPLIFDTKKPLAAATIDRVNNNNGYILNNIVLACRRCNSMKGSWLTHEQTLEIAHKYFETDNI